MTDYRTYEDSVDSGKPIELYLIYDSDGNYYRYNTGPIDIEYLGNTYVPEIIDRSEIYLGRFGGDGYPVRVSFTRSNLFTNRFIERPIDAIVTLILYRQHEGYYIQHWKGSLIHIGWDEDGMPTGTFESVLDAAGRMGHRRRCSRICDLVLYKYRCTVNQESYRVIGTISNMSSDGLTIYSGQFATKSDGWFVGGKIRIGTAYRLIKSHATNAIIIDRPFYIANVYDAFTAFAGCAHTAAACGNFANKINFGGNEYLPVQNPFEINLEI